ncbi:MAG TPA: polysaccharide biosynthesis tyrosine autokinase [Flavipsychrobacter sp.]
MDQSQQQIQARLLNQLNSSFDFKRLFGALITNWYWFVLTLSITLTAGFLYLRYTTPEYAIYSSLLMQEDKENPAQSLLSRIDPENDKSRINLFNEKVILQSQDMIMKVVDSLDINVRYWAIGRVKETELYKECPIKIVFDEDGFEANRRQITVRQIVEGQFELIEGERSERVLYGTWIKRDWGRFKILYVEGPEVNRGFLESTDFIVQIEHPDIATGRIGGRFGVELQDGRTSLLDLYYTDNIRERGVDFMNTLIYYYQKNELENINYAAEKTREFIQDRTASIGDNLKELDSMTVGIQKTNDVVDVKAETTDLMAQKTESDRRIEELVSKKQIIENLKNTLEIPYTDDYQIIAGVDVTDQNLSAFVQEYNMAIRERETLARNWGKAHPQLLDKESQIAAIRKRIIDAADKVLKNINRELSQVRENERQISERIRMAPEIEQEIKDVNRNYPVLQSIYLLLYQKLVENEISVYAATNKSKVVVVPYASGAPISPVPNRIYMMMFLLGVLVPGSIVVLREVLNNKVINENDIESQTSIPLIGSIGRADNANASGATIVVGPHVRTGIAEQFRLIRANLEFMSANKTNRIYMVTSSTSGEGKSFISINMGITMTLAKKRVIVMEFDLRKPKIAQYLGLPNDGGISGYLAGMCGLENVIKASGIHENLYIANCGPIPPNPGELLVSDKTRQLFEELQEMFDVIIIDTAPIGMVSDALILSQYASTNLFIIRQSYTVKDQVRMFDVLHKDGKIQNPAIIFNGVEFLRKYGYGYGGTSGYGYGYVYGYQSGGYGYYDDSSSKKKKRKKGLIKRFFTK